MRIEVDQRLGREDPESGRDPRRFQPLLRGDQRRARLERAEARARRLQQPVGRHDPGRAGEAEAPRRKAVDRVPFEGHGTAAAGPGPDHFLGQGEVDPADSAMAPGIVDLRRRAFGLARERRAHRADQGADSGLDLANAVLERA